MTAYDKVYFRFLELSKQSKIYGALFLVLREWFFYAYLYSLYHSEFAVIGYLFYSPGHRTIGFASE